jgi:glycosyltransferase involved in cell wall biosynthesis
VKGSLVADPVSPRITVLFPDDWAPFSPTLTRLVEALRRHGDVAVFCFDSGRFDHSSLDPTVYRPLRVPARLAWVLRKSGLWRALRPLLLAVAARRHVRGASAVVAVDGGGAVAATLLGRRFDFLSLEIARFSPARWLVPARARSIAIQSRDRLAFQFDPGRTAGLPVHFIQNSPSFREAPALRPRPQTGARLVYIGNVLPVHGLEAMLGLVAAWPEADLTLQGPATDAVRARVAKAAAETGGRVRLADGYIPDAQLPAFLSGFDIGLCLYDVALLGGDFNYLSAPSGKMFNYFAAGLPVLASAIPGLAPVERFAAGLQVRADAPDDLRRAAQTLLSRRDDFRAGALRAAEAFDFDRASAAWIEWLVARR